MNKGVAASPPGLRPFGAEPATQSQAEPLVPNAGRRLGGIDNLFADCCYGTSLQHAESDPCPRPRCIGCGNLADINGETDCDCPSGLLFLQGTLETMGKPRRLREVIAEHHAEISALEARIAQVIGRCEPPEDPA